MPDHVEDELRKMRERIAEQKRRTEQGSDPAGDVVVTQEGASVCFGVPDGIDLDDDQD